MLLLPLQLSISAKEEVKKEKGTGSLEVKGESYRGSKLVEDTDFKPFGSFTTGLGRGLG